MRRRTLRRLTARQQANAARCHLPLTGYLDLPYPVRKRRLWAAKKEARRG